MIYCALSDNLIKPNEKNTRGPEYYTFSSANKPVVQTLKASKAPKQVVEALKNNGSLKLQIKIFLRAA